MITQALLVSFRETIESSLIVSVILLYLDKTKKNNLISAVKFGILFAIGLSLAFGYMLKTSRMTGETEGGLALLAALTIIFSIIQIKKTNFNNLINSKMEQITSKPSTIAWISVFGFTILMIAREGVELMAILISISSNAELKYLSIFAFIGMALALLVARLWLNIGKKVQLKLILKITTFFMFLFAVQLLFYAFHEFSEANLLPFIDNNYWHEVTESFSPDSESGQILSVALTTLPFILLLVAYLKEKRLAKI